MILERRIATPYPPRVTIPDLDGEGVLPVGVHECTLDEIDQRFGAFNVSDKRIELVKQLRRYCEQLKKVDIASFIVVDGSFVTAKPEPGDIDILLVLRADADLAKELAPFEYNAISKRRVKQTYPFDLLVANEGSAAYTQQLEFFARVKNRPGLSKGLLKVKP